MSASDRPIEEAFPRRGERKLVNDYNVLLTSLTIVSVLLVLAIVGIYSEEPALAFLVATSAIYPWAQHQLRWLGTRTPINMFSEVWQIPSEDGGTTFRGHLGDVSLRITRDKSTEHHTVHAVVEPDIEIWLAPDHAPAFDHRRRFHPQLIVDGADADLAACWSDEDLEQLIIELEFGLKIRNHAATLRLPLKDATMEDIERQLVAPARWVASDLKRFFGDPQRALRAAIHRDGDWAGVDAYVALQAPLEPALRRAAWRGTPPLLQALAAHREGDMDRALEIASHPSFPPHWAAWLVRQAPEHPSAVLVGVRHSTREHLGGILQPHRTLPEEVWELLVQRAREGETLDPASWRFIRGGLHHRIELFAHFPDPTEAKRLADTEDRELRALMWTLSEDPQLPALGRQALKNLLAGFRDSAQGGGITMADDSQKGSLSVAADRGQIEVVTPPR